MRSIYHNRNFGVLEIILSVAILAIFSVSVLRLFVSASNDEKKMLKLDRADYAAVSYIEQFKGTEAPFDICEKLGGSKPVSDKYTGSVAVGNGMTASIQIKKDSENAGGRLYAITVKIITNPGKKEIYRLSDKKFFSK